MIDLTAEPSAVEPSLETHRCQWRLVRTWRDGGSIWQCSLTWSDGTPCRRLTNDDSAVSVAEWAVQTQTPG